METYFAGLDGRPALEQKYFYWGTRNSRLFTLSRQSEEGNVANFRNVMILINSPKV
jgi:hypothetical protein